MKHLNCIGGAYPAWVEKCVRECSILFYREGRTYYFRDYESAPLYAIGDRNDFFDYLKANCSRFYVQGFRNNMIISEKGFLDDLGKARKYCREQNKVAADGEKYKIFDFNNNAFVV